VRPSVVGVDDLLPDDCLDMDGTKGEVIDNLRVPQESLAAPPVMPIVRSDRGEVKGRAVVKTTIVYACEEF
jgi:hypothetical protein